MTQDAQILLRDLNEDQINQILADIQTIVKAYKNNGHLFGFFPSHFAKSMAHLKRGLDYFCDIGVPTVDMAKRNAKIISLLLGYAAYLDGGLEPRLAKRFYHVLNARGVSVEQKALFQVMLNEPIQTVLQDFKQHFEGFSLFSGPPANIEEFSFGRAVDKMFGEKKEPAVDMIKSS